MILCLWFTGDVCYCLNETAGYYVADQGACWGRCSNSVEAMDVCGDQTSNTVIYYDISEYNVILMYRYAIKVKFWKILSFKCAFIVSGG